ncbi:hypothetical protein [Streptomyces fagopyri]|uniref:hypothetical protein n=1 Tax=Streptomyces fagopyri TaxID=2662397 RepID=UPI00371FC2DC
MSYFLTPLATAFAIVALTTGVLVRRDRRRMREDSEALQSEATVTRNIPETGRRTGGSAVGR